MNRKLILTVILAIASSFNAVAQDGLSDKSLAAAEATYARSAAVFEQMRGMRQ